MSNIVPEKALNFSAYSDRGELLGIAEGTLPNIELLTSEVKGAGIAGSIESPGLGQVSSMTIELTWRNRSRSWAQLLTPESHTLDLYSAELDFDAGLGMYVTRSIHVYIKGVTKNYDFGKLSVNESTETKTTHEVYYLKFDYDGMNMLEIDKYNYIYSVNGVDYMQRIRSALGK